MILSQGPARRTIRDVAVAPDCVHEERGEEPLERTCCLFKCQARLIGDRFGRALAETQERFQYGLGSLSYPLHIGA